MNRFLEHLRQYSMPIAVLFVVFATGVIVGRSAPATPTASISPPSGECLHDEDCPAGEPCVNNKCQPVPQCYGDEECPARQACVNGKCVGLAPGACRKLSDCTGNQFCDLSLGLCKIIECEDNEGCPGGKWCDNGSCVLVPPGTCYKDSDCPVTGQQCVNEECVNPAPPPSPIGGPCENNNDCEPPGNCKGGTCRPVGYCEDDLDCAPGWKCVNNACTQATASAPASAAPMPSSQQTSAASAPAIPPMQPGQPTFPTPTMMPVQPTTAPSQSFLQMILKLFGF